MKELREMLNEGLKSQLYRLAGIIAGDPKFVEMFGHSSSDLIEQKALKNFRKIVDKMVKILEKYPEIQNSPIVKDIYRMAKQPVWGTNTYQDYSVVRTQFFMDKLEPLMQDWKKSDIREFRKLFKESLQFWDAKRQSKLYLTV